MDAAADDVPFAKAGAADVLPADVAARFLGVKRETLYAYASRGLLLRVPLGGGHRHGYLRADLERLKARADARAGHGAVAAGALRWGEPVLDTAISAIAEDGPVYRGHSALALAEGGVSFERVAELLWSGRLEASVPRWRPLPLRGASRAEGRERARGGVPLLLLLVARLGAGAGAPGRRSRSAPEGSLQDAVVLARGLVARLAGVDARGGAPVARALMGTLGARRVGPDAIAAVDRALVLVADHELNASTFAARVAAGAGAGMLACVAAALATLSGVRHGGECDRVEALLSARSSARRRGPALAAALRRGSIPPGFGHPLYPRGDPRTRPLLEAARSLSPAAMGPIDALVSRVEDAVGLRPTVDLGLCAVTRAIGARAGSAAVLFAVGRSAGWIGHILEQRAAGYVLRPRARYVGPAPRARAR